MKNPELVKKLLAELKTCATNDFELHRVEVLEKDLLEGLPVVEVIDDTHQKFNGVIYSQNKDGHFKNIHRDVYKYYCGEIPENYVVHHIDENKSNNSITNLQLLTSTEHQILHNAASKRPYKKCRFCGKIFHPKHNINVFCSEICFRNFQKSIKEKCLKKCPVCKKSFYAKSSRQVYCSKSCASVVKNDYKRLKEKICPICGKNFKPHRLSRQKTCSRQCAAKLSWQKRKS